MPKPGPPVVSISTVRPTPSGSGFVQAPAFEARGAGEVAGGGVAAGGGDVAAAGVAGSVAPVVRVFAPGAVLACAVAAAFASDVGALAGSAEAVMVAATIRNDVRVMRIVPSRILPPT
jgi:hypothetical protein